jgi:predicted P-loop ATPase
LLDYVAGGHEKQSDEYLGLVGRKFMCGLAARAMYPGIKFDTMIILEGEQYAGKSSLARIMATVNGEEYFLDDFKDIENKDALMKMQGKLIVEFPEISTLRKAEINDLKAFISRQEDEYRPPYGRTIRRSPRQCVFVGTVNPEGPYFKDMTGNRRYWPISCRSRLDLVGLKNAMPYLHAEAAHLVRNGEKLYLTETEYNIAKGEQEKRCMFDLWTDRIESYVKNYNRVATDDICAHLELSMDKRSPIVFGRIQQIMASLGYKPTRYRESGSLKRGFIKQETLNLYENEPVENVSW